MIEATPRHDSCPSDQLSDFIEHCMYYMMSETPHIINGHLCIQQRQQLKWLLITMEAPGIVLYCSEDCIIGSRPVVFCIHQTQAQTTRLWSQYRLSSPLGNVLFLEAW